MKRGYIMGDLGYTDSMIDEIRELLLNELLHRSIPNFYLPTGILDVS